MIVLNAQVPVVEQLAFGHDGRRLYAAGMWFGNRQFQRANHGIDVWNLSGQPGPAPRLLPDRVVNGFVVNPAGKWLYASADQYVLRDGGTIDSGYFAIDLATGQATPLGLTPYPRQLAISPSGDWLIGCGCVDHDWSDTRVVRWRQPSNSPPEPEREWTPRSHGERPEQIICDHTRSRVITFEESHEREQGRVGCLVSRDPSSWAANERFPLVDKSLGALSLSPDGSWLIGVGGPSLSVRDARDLSRTPQKIRSGKLHFTAVAFHPSGRYLAATSNDATVKLYDTASWQVAKTYTWDVGRMRSVAFSPDGTLAAAGSDTGKVVVWDVDV